jgi:hypothetical protein
MTTTEAAHKHMFPFEKPGVFGDYGPCECGLTQEQAQAGDCTSEQGQAAQSAFYAHFGTDADNGVAEIDEQHRPAWEAAARAVAVPLERERNILRGQLECAELTIAECQIARNALRAEFDRLHRELLDETRKTAGPGPVTAVPVTAAMLAAAFRRLRVVTVHPDGMPFGYRPLAAAIIAGFAEDTRTTRATADAKAAIEEAARDLDFRPGVAASILAAFPPPVQGKEIPLAAIFDGTHPRFLECDELRAMYAAHPAVKKVIDAAAGIEGRRESAS